MVSFGEKSHREFLYRFLLSGEGKCAVPTDERRRRLMVLFLGYIFFCSSVFSGRHYVRVDIRDEFMWGDDDGEKLGHRFSTIQYRRLTTPSSSVSLVVHCPDELCNSVQVNRLEEVYL